MKRIKISAEKIKNKLAEITDGVNTVYEHLPEDYTSFARLGLVKDGLYKQTEVAIQSIIDICAIINSDLRIGIPETEDSIFDFLEEEEIFPKEVLNLIRAMKRFRNVLVHRYGAINDEEAFQSIQDGRDDFEKIINSFEQVLKKYSERKKK